MQAAANQVRWVPVDEIVVPEGLQDDAPEGGVHVSPMSNGRYRLLSGSARFERMKEMGQVCLDVVLSPTEKMESRISSLLDALVKGDIHYLDEAERYRELLGSGTFGAGVFGADGIRILDAQYPALLVILPVGGFLTLACLIAFSQWLNSRLKEKEEKK